MKKRFKTIFSLFLFISACATTTQEGAVGINRKQFLWNTSTEEINDMALVDYKKIKDEAHQKNVLDTQLNHYQRIKMIAQKLISHTVIFKADAPNWNWETHVITSDQLNAYCMPGGKIVFYSGIIEKLKMTDGEIAAVMGHEIAHALREHGRERVAISKSQGLVQQLGIGLLLASGKVSDSSAQGINQIAGLGTSLLLTLPNSREQESEADDIGLELMARAGYDPQEAVNLWIKMSNTAGGKKPPAMLSTHPSDERRIEDIKNLIPKVQNLYLQSSKK